MELRRKLRVRGLVDEVITPAIDDLAAAQLQSDERFAEMRVRVRCQRGYGPRYIEADLRQRGVAAELIRAALDVPEAHWQVQAAVARRKQFGEPVPDPRRSEDRKEWARQARYLQNRGYTQNQIHYALENSPTDDDESHV